MVNEAIAISLRENVYGRLRLRDRIYKEFQARYGVVSCFPYSVAEVAWSIVKKHNRWSRKPFARRLMMKLDVQNYSLNHSILSIPFKRDERILIPLKYGDYQRSFLSETTLKRGSVTITESAVIIAFTKITRVACPSSRLGIDLNERSIVCSDGGRFDLSEVSRLHTEYGIRRRTFYRKYPHDRRLKAKFASSSRERNRVRQFLHRAAKAVVEVAAKNSQAIVLEKLSGIRYAHHKGNGEGEGQRRRIAQWPFRLFQSFVLYKGAWSGVQVEFVSALRTSQICNKCGKVNTHLRLTEREWRCPNCGASLDRDLNAAINIERRGAIACLGEVRPGAQDRDEAMKGNEATTAPILRVEALKLARLYFSVEHVEPEGD
jgi:putative transposase